MTRGGRESKDRAIVRVGTAEHVPDREADQRDDRDDEHRAVAEQCLNCGPHSDDDGDASQHEHDIAGRQDGRGRLLRHGRCERRMAIPISNGASTDVNMIFAIAIGDMVACLSKILTKTSSATGT